MSHDSYLTTQDKLESLASASEQGITLGRTVSIPWSVVALGLGIAAFAASSGLLAFGLGAAAIYSGYQAAEGLIKETFLGSKPKAASEHDTSNSSAAAHAPIPQLVNEGREGWRNKVSSQTSRYNLERRDKGL